MTVVLDPKHRFWLTVDGKADCGRYQFRHMTFGESLRIQRVIDTSFGGTSLERCEIILEVLTGCLCAYEKVLQHDDTPAVFGEHPIENLMTQDEAVRLVIDVLQNGRITENDQKK